MPAPVQSVVSRQVANSRAEVERTLPWDARMPNIVTYAPRQQGVRAPTPACMMELLNRELVQGCKDLEAMVDIESMTSCTVSVPHQPQRPPG